MRWGSSPATIKGREEKQPLSALTRPFFLNSRAAPDEEAGRQSRAGRRRYGCSRCSSAAAAAAAATSGSPVPVRASTGVAWCWERPPGRKDAPPGAAAAKAQETGLLGGRAPFVAEAAAFSMASVAAEPPARFVRRGPAWRRRRRAKTAGAEGARARFDSRLAAP